MEENQQKKLISVTVSIIGLGKLGFPLLVAVASRGFPVMGFDIKKEVVAKIASGQVPVFEPHVEHLFHQNKKLIKVTTNLTEAIINSNLSFVVVPTPSTADGSFTAKYVKQAVKAIVEALREKSSYHLISIISTLSPTSMDREIFPLIKNQPKKKIGLCYNPSFIALGNVIHNLLFPDFILIGESDSQAGRFLAGFYRKFCRNRPPIVRMNFINSEITKISLNAFITTKISFANMLASLCQRVSGANIDVITQAIGLDSRIGEKYLKGAVAYGGPCFPRDNQALVAFGKQAGMTLLLPKVTDEINRLQTKEIASLAISRIKRKATVGILGLSYKQNTNVIEKSQGILLAKYLARHNYKVLVYDPSIKKGEVIIKQKNIFSRDIEEIVAESDALIITTPWPEFSQRLPGLLTNKFNKSIILIDCWRIIDPQILPKKIIYVARGRRDKNHS